MSSWNLTGNAGTDKKVNFVGTTDDNPLVISTNGKEAVHIDQSGNVAIGTQIPQVKLHVKGNRIRLESSDASHTLDLRADGAALDIESNGAPLWLNGTKQPTFLNPNGGNVGIGTIDPKVPLHVKGNRTRLESVDGNRTLDLRADGSALDIESKGAALFLNGTQQPTLLNPFGGNVGIGMIDPRFPLHVNGPVLIQGTGFGLAMVVFGQSFNVGTSVTDEIVVRVGGEIWGYLKKSGGGFSIDHPLDPANKFLNHGFVESPKMKNIYDGIVTLDGNGEATVEMPDWFEQVNEEYCYQLSGIGSPSPNLYVAEEIANNRFKLAGGVGNQKVCWQVTGIRKDPWARKNSLPVEEEKLDKERGYYLHPELYNQPEERSLMRLRYPAPEPQ
jgi:hypothetical protein